MQPRAKQIFGFLALLFAFSSLPYYLIIHSGHLSVGNGLITALLMWCPGLAAFAACALFKIDVGSLGWNWRPARYQAWSYVIPILYALPVYVAAWIFIPGSFAYSTFAESVGRSFGFAPRVAALCLGVPLYASVGVVSAMARTLGEEIGWRGFLFPRLFQQTGFTWGCLLTGCVWALWHYPVLLFADYNAGTNPAYALICFTLLVFSASFIWGWLRLKSGSLWTSTILHASHNLFIQAIFDRMTAPAGRTLYVTTEFGVGLVLTMGAVAIYLWSRRNEVSGQQREPMA